MKQYILFLLIATTLNINFLCAQNYKLNPGTLDPVNFLGKWMATDDNVDYIIEFKQGELPGDDTKTKIIHGSLEVKKNNAIIRKIPINSLNSFLTGVVYDETPNILKGVIQDKEENMIDYITFTASKDYTKAEWKYENGHERLSGTVKSTYPDNLKFKKIE